MPNLELAKRADKILREARGDKYYHVSYEYMPSAEIFDSVTGTVIYVGCGEELSSIFLFQNAKCYIHQDLNDPGLDSILRVLERKGIISRLRIIGDGVNKGVSEFELNGQRKILIEIHGKRQKEVSLSNKGDIAFNVPPEATQDLGAIYFFGMPDPFSIKAIELNLLPRLKIGGLFVGPYPYANGRFEGAKPEDLGLEYIGKSTSIKVRHLSKEQIQERIKFSIEDYRERIKLKIAGGEQ